MESHRKLAILLGLLWTARLVQSTLIVPSAGALWNIIYCLLIVVSGICPRMELGKG